MNKKISWHALSYLISRNILIFEINITTLYFVANIARD